MKFLYSMSLIMLLVGSSKSFSQTSGEFKVYGDADKYYPVTFNDGMFENNAASELELGRSWVHTDASWNGSLIAKFRYHTYNWGNASQFIDADIRQYQADGSALPFIAGWADATGNNSNLKIVIWLKGGSKTYYYKSNTNPDPKVYDGVQNPNVYTRPNGGDYTFKTGPDAYVNSKGVSYQGTIYSNGTENNYFNGNVGIGTTAPSEKLSVNGKIRAHEIKVETVNWPDYVFNKDYKLPTLEETESHIKEKGHLPGIPSAKETEENGISLGEMNAMLLKKIEELTLHVIEQSKQLNEQKLLLNKQQELLEQQNSRINKLEH